MKKIGFFVPAIIFIAFYGWIIIATGFSVSPMVLIWIVLFILSGILLTANIFWGGVFGVLPGIHLMYMSTIDTGQIINIELPMGIIITVFYLICCFVVYRNKTKTSPSL